MKMSRGQNIFRRPLVNSLYNGLERVSFLGPKIWDMVPKNIKTLEFLNSFKKEIWKWKSDDWPSRLYRTYIQSVNSLIFLRNGHVNKFNISDYLFY